MHFLNHLEVLNFRNLKPQTISLEKQVTIFVGENGQGKTSILEAIYFLSQNRSFRTTRIDDLKQWGASKGKNEIELLVRGAFQSIVGREEVAIEIREGRKYAIVNGKKATTANDFYGKFCCLVFSPSDMELIQGAPSSRRQFVDRVLSGCDNSYISELVEYHRGLKQKNAVLQQARKSHINSSVRKQIGIWNELLAGLSLSIAEKRLTFSLELNRMFTKYYKEFTREKTNPNQETVNLQLKSMAAIEGIIKTKQTIEDELNKSLAADVQMRTSTTGIHRDDLLVEIDCGEGSKNARRAASQGQARSMVMAMKLAASDYITSKRGEAPVLLLDDLESELDENRKQALLNSVLLRTGQVIITATNGSIWEKIACSSNSWRDTEIFSVFNGSAIKK